jgi:hypothetical protein
MCELYHWWKIQINVASRSHVHYLYYVSSKIRMFSRRSWWQGRKSYVLFAVRCQICLAAASLSVQKSQAEAVVGVVQCLSSLHHNPPSLLLSSQNPTARSEAANSIYATGQLNGWIKLAQDVWSLLLISVILCWVRSPGVLCRRNKRTKVEEEEEEGSHILYVLYEDDMLLYI